MTDRELLEAAAKAAGIKVLRDPHGAWRNCTGGDPAMNIFAAPLWNPLSDDGDALRLAVKLNLLVMPYPDDNAVRVVVWGDGSNPKNCIVSWGTPPDAAAATRRAIVQAAAGA